MYRSIRIVRIVISLSAMLAPTWALIAGYDSVFERMQVVPALLSGAAICLVLWGFATILYGRIYCSTVCPMGTFIDCVSAVGRISEKRRANYRYASPSSRTRLLFLLLALLALLSGMALLPTVLDPYSAYARIVEEIIVRPLGRGDVAVRYGMTSLALAVFTALLVVAFSWRKGRLVCNTVCPVGTVLGYVARKSVFHIEIDPDRCIHCGECERVCKSQCIKLPDKLVDNSRCVVCFDCASVCPNNAVSYKSGRFHLRMPMMQAVDGSGTGRASLNTPEIRQKIKTENDETISRAS